MATVLVCDLLYSTTQIDIYYIFKEVWDTKNKIHFYCHAMSDECNNLMSEAKILSQIMSYSLPACKSSSTISDDKYRLKSL